MKYFGVDFVVTLHAIRAAASADFDALGAGMHAKGIYALCAAWPRALQPFGGGLEGNNQIRIVVLFWNS